MSLQLSQSQQSLVYLAWSFCFGVDTKGVAFTPAARSLYPKIASFWDWSVSPLSPTFSSFSSSSSSLQHSHSNMSNSLDTHCDGPGLSAFSPKPWWVFRLSVSRTNDHLQFSSRLPKSRSSWERTKRRYFNEYASELISTGFDRNSETLLNLSCLILPTATYDLPTRVDLTGRWAIVSGGNSGIGRECARTLVSWNCNVILACRDPPPHEPHPDQVIKELKEMLAESSSKSAESKQPELEYWQIDYSSFKSVKAFAEKWLASGRTLYYLFNNAGLGSGGLNFIKTEDEFELTHQVNFLSHCLLTFMILPTMKQAKTPRIINTASAFHSDGDLDFRSVSTHW